MSKDDLKEHCTKVLQTLTAKGMADIDGPEMVEEIMIHGDAYISS